jgi:hypothetical protein
MNLGRWKPLAILLLSAACFLALDSAIPTTWEWDAVGRAVQAQDLANYGVSWYFPSHFGWLPFWQFLLAGLWIMTAKIWPAVTMGTVVSSLSAGLLILLVARFAQKHGWDTRVAVIALLTSGTFVAYSGQSMTDVLSALLLFSSVFLLLEYIAKPQWNNLALLICVTSLNMLLRYEAWFFTAVMILFILWISSSRKSRKLFRASIVLITVSGLIVASWMYLSWFASGYALGFETMLLANNGHQLFPWFSNIVTTASQLFVAMTLATGLLWVCLCYACYSWKEDWQKLFILLFGVYLTYFAYSLYVGYNSGWAREMLYFLPLGSVSLASTRLSTRFKYVILIACAVIGVIAFSQNAVLASHYGGPCCP